MSVFLTEANIAHKSFIQEVIGRTISTPEKYRRLYFDLNPKSANDWFYKEFLDIWESKNELSEVKLNFSRTTYWDNPVLTENQRNQIQLEYDPESLLYKIYILGQRLAQVDHVYVLRDENILNEVPEPDEYIIAVDVGISSSATTYVTMGAAQGKLYIYDLYYHKSGREVEGPHVKNVHDYANDLADYYRKTYERFGKAPSYIYLDRDVTFLRTTTEVFRKQDLPHNLLKYAIKEDIMDRIKTVSSLLYKQKLFISNKADMVIDAFRSAVYDSKALDEKGKLERLDEPNPNKDVMNPIDIIDPVEYAVSHFVRRIRGLVGE